MATFQEILQKANDVVPNISPKDAKVMQDEGALIIDIRELEEVLSVSQVVEYKTMGVEDRVIFGSTVTIKDLESEEIKTYQIVGDAEADIERNPISFTTPMAMALINKALGEFVEV